MGFHYPRPAPEAETDESKLSRLQSEVEYLRFMCYGMYECLGPADGEIVKSIDERWTAKGRWIPVRFRDDD